MLIPTRGKIIVENIPDTKITESGLYIAETIKEVPHRGRIISIGLPAVDKKGREKEWHFKEGEIVHYKRKWTNPGAELFILLRDDIYAVEGEMLRAVMDLVIIKRHYTGNIGGGSIVIPTTYGVQQNEEDYYGEVIAEGPESHFNFKHGDKIHFHRNEGIEFKYKEQQYFSLKQRAILALLED